MANNKPVFYTDVNGSSEDILTVKDLVIDKLNDAEVKINELSEKDSNGNDKVNVYTGLSYEELINSPELTAAVLYPDKHFLGDGIGVRDKQRHAYIESDSTNTSDWWTRNPDTSDVTIQYTGTPFRLASHFDSAVSLKDGLVVFNTAEKYIYKNTTTQTADPRYFPVLPNTLSNVSDKICGVLDITVVSTDSSATEVYSPGSIGDKIVMKAEDIEALTSATTLFSTIKSDITFYPETSTTIDGDIKLVDKYIECEMFDSESLQEGIIYRAIIRFEPDNKNICRTDGCGIILLNITDSRT